MPKPLLYKPAALLLAAVAMLATAAPSLGQSAIPVAERRVEQRLARPISVNYPGVPLEAVLDDLRRQTGVNFDIRWRQLEAAGVSRDTPIELLLRRVPAGIILRRVLKHAGNEFEPIGYSIQAGIVTAAPQRELDRRLVTRVYDVRDILNPVRDFNNAPRLDVNAVLNATGQGQTGGGTTDIFNDDNNDADDPPTRAERVQRLIDLIQEMVIEPSNPTDA